MNLDETSISNGEFHTDLTNKSVKEKKGSIVAIVKMLKKYGQGTYSGYGWCNEFNHEFNRQKMSS
ncbi:hypothetical protein [Tenacibaculum piscium]|uniref:hypothetical protein n=1 Tax=Tenacibaculum piscium TaxID=1458515 RepID=UPI001F394BCE|nr:hypothetical protein [Tenacibaculum piscium]